MRYISIDIETTGLDPDKHQIISFAAIIEDTENKVSFENIIKFKRIIKRTEVTGSITALNMNFKILSYIDKYNQCKTIDEKKEFERECGYTFIDEDDLAKDFYRFLLINGFETIHGNLYDGRPPSTILLTSDTKPICITVAGKNFGTFDRLFLQKLPWWKKVIQIKQRIIDPAVLYVDWKNDKTLPSLDVCKKRANIDGDVSHDAIEDAWDVIQLLRKHY